MIENQTEIGNTQSHEETSKARPTLDEVELRVLGVLIEKSLTQASAYPMTINAIVLGANQKQNRDPVVEYSESDVSKALYRLERQLLVKQAPPSPGARANRFAHLVVERFHWDRREQAVMGELMLRGRQTPGELRTHGSRMTPLTDLESVAAILHGLSTCNPSYVKELPREPGRSANRWRHLLAGESSVAGPSPKLVTHSEMEPVGPASGNSNTEELLDSMTNRIARLEARIGTLELAVAALRGQTGPM